MKQVKTSVSEELDAWLEERAAEEHRSVSSLIRVILYEAKALDDEKALA